VTSLSRPESGPQA